MWRSCSTHPLLTLSSYLIAASSVFDGVVAFVPTHHRTPRDSTSSSYARHLSLPSATIIPVAGSRGSSKRKQEALSISRKSDNDIMAEGASAAANTASLPSDANHHPSALRNRAVISAEVSRWLLHGEGKGNNSGHVLEIASGTGCHIESFARALPSWTFKPTEVSGMQLIPHLHCSLYETTKQRAIIKHDADLRSAWFLGMPRVGVLGLGLVLLFCT